MLGPKNVLQQNGDLPKQIIQDDVSTPGASGFVSPGSKDRTNLSGSSPGRLGWLKSITDNKPWWSIVIVAMLGAFGSEPIKNLPDIVTWGRSFFSREFNVYVFATDKRGNNLNDVAVSFLDIRDGKLIPVHSGDTEVKTDNGLAHAVLRVKPGPEYAAIARYSFVNKRYQTTSPISIQGDMQKSIEFDPEKWALVGDDKEIKINTQPSSTTESMPTSKLPPWMKYAYDNIGQPDRIKGDINPKIWEYFGATSLRPTELIDWSSAFVNWSISQAGYPGTRSANSRSWLSWGMAVPPQVGCIAVFWRGDPNGNLGHVGFYVGDDETGIAVLGGNQNHSVNISRLSKSNFLGCRWPT